MNLPIYVLYRPERRARAQAELTKLGWQAAFVEGPPALSAAEAAAHWPSWVDPGCTLPGGQIACHVGHARVLERIVDQPALVLEDDFVPALDQVEARILRILAQADACGAAWDYLNLGRCYGGGGDPALGWEGVAAEVGLCGHAALITPAGARRLLAEPLRDRPTDWIARDLAVRGELRGFAASPRLFAQERQTLPTLCGNYDDMPEFAPVRVDAYAYLAIPGWFNFAEAYRELVADADDEQPSLVVELGAWKGRSTAFLAAEILGSGKPIYLTVVDLFQGSVEGEGLAPASAADVALGDLREVFDRNLAPFAAALGERLRVIQGDSAAAAARFQDGTVAAVWVDAGHAEAEVQRDLAAWWPKLALGGLLGGDDWAWTGVAAAVEAFCRREGLEVELGGAYPWWRVWKD